MNGWIALGGANNLKKTENVFGLIDRLIHSAGLSIFIVTKNRRLHVIFPNSYYTTDFVGND